MESHSLQSASTYLNNLLLARGLLQNGKAINFAHPGDESNNTDATMSRVINLVHDLVLRRDREADQRETLATNIRTLRAEESQRVLDMQRVQDKNAELARNISTAEAQERALKSSLRKAEAQARELKEQTLKIKSMLDQVRAKCLSDVRKRDTEIEKLKTHISGMQRGKREASGMKINVINPQPSTAGRREMRSGQDVNSADWSLEKETNDFLAALVNETSAENVALRQIVGETMEVLQELTGLEQAAEAAPDILEQDGIGIPGQHRKSRQPMTESSQEEALVSCEVLAINMSAILDHCRSILKDPSFVPIEEVQIREEEIIKLRAGWEKMANRWKEAVTMMDSWRRRMLEGGKSVNFEEFSDLGFGRSVAVLPNGLPVLGEDNEVSSILFDTSKMDGLEADVGGSEDVPPAISAPHPELSEEESELEIPAEPSPKRLAASPARRGLKLPRPVNPLNEINNNLDRVPRQEREHSALTRSGDSGIGSLDGSVDADVENDTFRSRPRSRIPRQSKKENEPSLTVSQKLAAIEAEAKEAEERRQQEEVTHKRKAPKSQGWRKATRRRSTLSPDELAALMGVR